MSMSSVEALNHVLASMRSYASDGKFAAAKRLNEQAITILLDAIFAQDRDAIASMRERLAAFASEARSQFDDGEALDLTAELEANVRFASVASRRRPQGVLVDVPEAAGDAREKALVVLKRFRSLGTNELAEKLGIRKETMSRILTALKAEGLVTSHRAGRRVISRLTPRGRERVSPKDRQIELKVTLPDGMNFDQFVANALASRLRNAFSKDTVRSFPSWHASTLASAEEGEAIAISGSAPIESDAVLASATDDDLELDAIVNRAGLKEPANHFDDERIYA